MTPRQAIAYASPCARAWETLDPRFRVISRAKGSAWSTILTLNK